MDVHSADQQTGATTADPSVLGPSAKVDEIAKTLKVLGHAGRLRILWHLARGDRSVSELEFLLQQRQPAVSQQLARLRRIGLVEARRQGKTIIYSLAAGVSGALVERILAMIPSDRHPG